MGLQWGGLCRFAQKDYVLVNSTRRHWVEQAENRYPSVGKAAEVGKLDDALLVLSDAASACECPTHESASGMTLATNRAPGAGRFATNTDPRSQLQKLLRKNRSKALDRSS
jgi:hypothetical protein